MPSEFTGIDRRLDELSERLARLRPLQAKTRDDFAQDPYLRDIVVGSVDHSWYNWLCFTGKPRKHESALVVGSQLAGHSPTVRLGRALFRLVNTAKYRHN